MTRGEQAAAGVGILIYCGIVRGKVEEGEGLVKIEGEVDEAAWKRALRVCEEIEIREIEIEAEE